MTSNIPVRKAKINLTDYSFRRDIELRLMIARLSLDEVKILQDIIYHSLTISIEQLADEVDISVSELLPILNKLSLTKLFKIQNKTLIVDKEIRKFFEVKIEHFNSDFRPDLEFLQGALNKVPIHVLPLWYAIPRSTDHIFGSIIEKYFLTPKIFQQYLSEIQFDEPILLEIMKEVYQPPHFKVTVAHLMDKFHLTHACVEEYLLLLEYHFVCCLSYQQVDGFWEEIVTPFAEWKEFLHFEFQTNPNAITEEITKYQQVEFQLLKDLTTILQGSSSKGIITIDAKQLHSVPAEHEQLVDRLIQVEFAKKNSSNQIVVTEKGKKWAKKSIFEQIDSLANDPLFTLRKVEDYDALWNMRNIDFIKKSLRKLPPNQWVEYSDFVRGCIEPLNAREPVTLKNKGKKWKYVLPEYTEQEIQFIKNLIFEIFMELGIVQTGQSKNKACFCLTHFGHHFIQ